MSSRIVERSLISAIVTDYYIENTGQTYDLHCFGIKVSLRDLEYSVDRSYVDFVHLDLNLRKRFPRTTLSQLPLDGISQIEKGIQKKKAEPTKPLLGSSSQSSRLSMSGSPFSLLSKEEKFFHIQDRSLSNFESKISLLNDYISEIISHHELITSDDFLLFLDEEARDMTVDPQSLEPLSVHDILLLNEPQNKSTVFWKKEFVCYVRTGQVVLWKFTTIDYDIAFTVDMNGEIKVPLTRFNSHQRAICGSLESPSNAMCKLIWDNSYAKLRTKQLSFVARVVGAEDFEVAHTQALEVQREKRKFEVQRHTLRVAVTRHASLLSGVIYDDSVLSDQLEEEDQRARKLEDQVDQLKRQVSHALEEIAMKQVRMESLRIENQTVENERDQLRESFKFSEKQLRSSQEKLRGFVKESGLLESELQSLQGQITEMVRRLNETEDEAVAARQREGEKVSAFAIAQADAKQSLARDKFRLQSELEERRRQLQEEYDSAVVNFDDDVRSETESQADLFAQSVQKYRSLLSQETSLRPHLESLQSQDQDLALQLNAQKDSLGQAQQRFSLAELSLLSLRRSVQDIQTEMRALRDENREILSLPLYGVEDLILEANIAVWSHPPPPLPLLPPNSLPEYPLTPTPASSPSR